MYKTITPKEMDYTDELIVVFDLGSTRIVGSVGTKDETGRVSILAYEISESSSYMRRGNIYNVAKAASEIKRMCLKLENKIGEGRVITSAYFGIDAQSIHSIGDKKEERINGEITQQVIDLLIRRSKGSPKDDYGFISSTEPVFYLDGIYESRPMGKTCNMLEARFNRIFGNPAITTQIHKIAEKIGIKVKKVILMPLAIGDAVLAPRDMDAGCALIDFGGGVTSLVIYKDGAPTYVKVIPLGGDLITHDLEKELKLSYKEAERVKIVHGSSVADPDSIETIRVESNSGLGQKEMRLYTINRVIEARELEIIENVIARFEASGYGHDLLSGIVLCGGASCLTNLEESLKGRIKQTIRYARLRREFIIPDDEKGNDPILLPVMSLLRQGEGKCVIHRVSKETMLTTPSVEKEVEVKVSSVNEETKVASTNEEVNQSTEEKEIGIEISNIIEEVERPETQKERATTNTNKNKKEKRQKGDKVSFLFRHFGDIFNDE